MTASSEPTRNVSAIDIVEDRTAAMNPQEGFLRFRRLVLRNRYDDGTVSEPYPCDMMSRERVDAVAVLLYDRKDGRTRVALRTGVRPPLFFRPEKEIPHKDDTEEVMLIELVAGLLEVEDAVPDGVERRASLECAEEAGYAVDPEDVQPLGTPMFASPGCSDERVHYRCVETDLDVRGTPYGDGSVMEEAGEVVILDLNEAVRMCRDGRIRDAKTELALLRLRDQLPS